MNIDGLGPETVDMFYRLGLIHNTADLYDLSVENIKGLDRMGEKSAENIITGIAQSIIFITRMMSKYAADNDRLSGKFIRIFA